VGSKKSYSELLKEIMRERETEEKVRALDACDIVQWIHRLEDEIKQLEEPPTTL